MALCRGLDSGGTSLEIAYKDAPPKIISFDGGDGSVLDEIRTVLSCATFGCLVDDPVIAALKRLKAAGIQEKS